MAANIVDSLHQPPQTRHTNVDDLQARRAIIGKRARRLAAHRYVRGTPADHRDMRGSGGRVDFAEKARSCDWLVIDTAPVVLRERRERVLLQTGQQQRPVTRRVEGSHKLVARLAGAQDGLVKPDALTPLNVQLDVAVSHAGQAAGRRFPCCRRRIRPAARCSHREACRRPRRPPPSDARRSTPRATARPSR